VFVVNNFAYASKPKTCLEQHKLYKVNRAKNMILDVQREIDKLPISSIGDVVILDNPSEKKRALLLKIISGLNEIVNGGVTEVAVAYSNASDPYLKSYYLKFKENLVAKINQKKYSENYLLGAVHFDISIDPKGQVVNIKTRALDSEILKTVLMGAVDKMIPLEQYPNHVACYADVLRISGKLEVQTSDNIIKIKE
jgi:hypothetical protein